MTEQSTPAVDYEKVLDELARIAEQRKTLEEYEETLKSQLRTLGLGKSKVGKWEVSIAPNRRLNADKVMKAYPPEDFPLYYKTTPNTGAIKSLIGDEEYATYMDEVGAPRISYH